MQISEPPVVFILLLESISAHLVLHFFMFALVDTKIRWRSMLKIMAISIPISTFAAYLIFLSTTIDVLIGYAITSCVTLFANVAAWTYVMRWKPLKSFTAFNLAAALQVGTTAIFSSAVTGSQDVRFLRYVIWLMLVYPASMFIVCTLLIRLKSGKHLRYLLSDRKSLHLTAAAAFMLEVMVELLFTMRDSLQANFTFIYIINIMFALLLIVCFFTYISAKGERDSKIRMQEAMLLEQRHYMEGLESMQSEMRAFRHDYKNMLTGISLYADEGNTEEIRKTLQKMEVGFDQKVGANLRQAAQLGNIQNPELKSLVLSKLTRMKEKKIACNLEVLYPVTAIEMDATDLNRCLGILLDNAIDAVEHIEKPTVDLIISSQNAAITIIVKNPWQGELALHRIWDEGYSTKGKGRGLGLSSCRRVLDGYPNAFPSTSWKNGIFTQEIKVAQAD